MEALRTQVDYLQWEVNRLDVENQRLRASDEASQRVDLESELEQTKQDVQLVTTELEACKRRLDSGSLMQSSRHQKLASLVLRRNRRLLLG